MIRLGELEVQQVSVNSPIIERHPPFYLTTGEVLYLTGKTIRLLAAEHNVFNLFDRDGSPVLDSEFYEISKDGIVRVE